MKSRLADYLDRYGIVYSSSYFYDYYFEVRSISPELMWILLQINNDDIKYYVKKDLKIIGIKVY